MVLNVDKCAVMSTTHSHNKIIYPYAIGNEQLKRVSMKKELGVIIDDKTINVDVDNITRKSYRTLGFIFRCIYCIAIKNWLEFDCLAYISH